MSPDRIVVTGWRKWKSLDSVFRVLNHVREKAPSGEVYLGVGDCPTGADLYAFQWAKVYGVPYERYVANWKDLGKRAGMVRNRAMVDLHRPALGIAFLHPESVGGMACRDYMRSLEIPIFEVWA